MLNLANILSARHAARFLPRSGPYCPRSGLVSLVLSPLGLEGQQEVLLLWPCA